MIGLQLPISLAAAASLVLTTAGLVDSPAAEPRAIPEREDSPLLYPLITPVVELLVYEGRQGRGEGRHIVLVAGDDLYRSEEAVPQLARILAVHHGFRCTVLFPIGADGTIDPEVRDHLPGLEVLEEADLLVLFTRRLELPDEDMRWIVEFEASGRPIVGIRTATQAFAYPENSESPYRHWGWGPPYDRRWPGGFGRYVLGESWIREHGELGRESTRARIPEGTWRHPGFHFEAPIPVRDHPILRGVSDFWVPSNVDYTTDLRHANVLVVGAVLDGMAPDSPSSPDWKNDPCHPIVWTRESIYSSPGPDRIVTQRTVYCGVGAAADLESEDLRRLLVNACYWAMKLVQIAPAEAVVDLVGDFEPSPFGLGNHRRGVRPRDLALPD